MLLENYFLPSNCCQYASFLEGGFYHDIFIKKLASNKRI